MAKEHVADQGKQASALGLTADDCPYLEGDNREHWLKAFEAAEAKKAAPAASE